MRLGSLLVLLPAIFTAAVATSLVGRAADGHTDSCNHSDLGYKAGKKCSHPDHASPICKKDDPCAFECKDGYMPYPSYKPVKCVCSPPKKECNGKCGDFHGCPSGKPHYKRDPAIGSVCPVGLKACGIWGRGAKTWECIDTRNDLESCGGCVIPLFNGLSEPKGQDCTALTGVSDVSCIDGKCVVRRCLAGYKLHPNKTSCL